MTVASAPLDLRFDRGTLLVDAQGAELLSIPHCAWDARVKAPRAPAWRYPEVAAHLTTAGVPFGDAVLARGDPPAPWPPVDLRPYQAAALDAWELGHRRGLIVLPTGSGKTRVALAAMARAGTRALCLVPTRVLLEQWLRVLALAHPGPIGCYGDGRHDVRGITVATFESAYRHMDQLGDRFELLIVDEAHHFGGGVRDEALELSAAPWRLGLTATPCRGSPADRLDELIGPTVFELAIGDLAGTFLASFDAITMHVDLTASERADHDRCMTTFRDVHAVFRRLVPDASSSWADFVRWAARTEAGRQALAGHRQALKILHYPEAKRRALASLLVRHRAARTLVFTADNDTAYAIAREHLVMPLTCDIDRRERAAALARFQAGELRVLVSARVLNEGLDVPDAEVAIVVAGTQGEREHVQRVGRLLRPRDGKRALVYELVCRGTVEVRHSERRRKGLAGRTTAQL